MAAETVAIELVKVVVGKMTDEAFKRIARAQGIHNELKELKSTLSRIQDLLNDASQKEVSDKTVKSWLNGLQHLAYDIDDVLDDVATEAMHRELTLQEHGASTSMVRKLIPTCFTNLSLTHRLAPKLDTITTKLQHLEKQNPGLIVIGEKLENNSRRNETSLPDGSRVVGREGEVEKLLKKLLGDDGSSKENFSIVPIVGMGGVGKTTLARILYNDTQVKNHFELHVWICVSDDFDIFKISKTMFQDVTRENKEFENLNQLHMALTNQFSNKRFLLVLDDVWHEDHDDWENLVRPFHSCAPGSRIIMTTRKQELLIKLGFDHQDRLKSLPHEDALSLFALHALGVENFDSHTTLQPHAEAIVKKCAGLPLALKAIGKLLAARTNEEDWIDVLNSEIWNLENSDKFVPALRLSYHDLPADLKQLFAYCSLFPKDFLFEKEKLVLLWMAEGFLNQSNAAKLPERLGHEYFEVLLSRSFFQHAPNNESLFVMHDMMNDLATFVAGEHFLRFDNHMKIDKETLAKHRHMSFTHETYVGYHEFQQFKSATSLRTLLAVSVEVEKNLGNLFLSQKILVELLPKLSLLRVLSLSCFSISEVPECIGNLKHLRYLNLSQTNIKELPESVGNLYNLQILSVFSCRMLIKLPKSFLKLKRLRHFDIRDTLLLNKLPLGIAKLESLQTLSKIIIGGDDGFAITELKGLKNLYGEISIEGLHKVQSAMHAREANLSLKRFTNLELKWDDGSHRGTLEKEVLNELKPNNDKLNELAIVSYRGTEFSNWVGDPSFHHLVSVSIRGCKECTSLPPFWQLPSLKELYIQGMDEVKTIGLELIDTTNTTVVFPSLEILWFQDMCKLEVWSTNNDVLAAAFPRLRELQVESCPKLIDVSLEALPLLKHLVIIDCGVVVLRSLLRAASLVKLLMIQFITGLTDEVWRDVIKYLGNVEILTISYCNEIRYLCESVEETCKVLSNIKDLHVAKCKNLVSLREKEEDHFESNLLSSLWKLEISDCESMKHCYCPHNIEYLHINGCSSLTRVSFPSVIGGGAQKLKIVLIHGCMKLREETNNTSMPMLEMLHIYRWTSLKSITQFSNFNHLTYLYLQNCPSMELFQLSNLTSLTHLAMINHRSFCGPFHEGFWPPNLVNLRIGWLKNPISQWGPLYLPASLVTLFLDGEPNVSNFGSLSYLLPASLTSLKIGFFDDLESLSTGLQHLSSLQHLRILRCPDVKHLPETLLPSLLSLRIEACPHLAERSNGRGSHYWPLIYHIPCIKIAQDMIEED